MAAKAARPSDVKARTTIREIVHKHNNGLRPGGVRRGRAGGRSGGSEAGPACPGDGGVVVCFGLVGLVCHACGYGAAVREEARGNGDGEAGRRVTEIAESTERG